MVAGRIERTFLWKNRDFRAVLDALKTHLMPLAGPEPRFRGTYELSDRAGTSLEFEHLGEMEQQAPTEVGAFSCSISSSRSSDIDVSLRQWSHTRERLSVDLRIASECLDRGQQAVDAFASSLALQPYDEERADRRLSIRIEKEYRWRKYDARRLYKEFEDCFAHILEPAEFRGRIRSKGPNGRETSYPTRELFLANIIGEIEFIDLAMSSVSSPYALVGAEYDVSDRGGVVRIRSNVLPSQEPAIQTAITKFEQSMALAPLGQRTTKNQGIKALYFTTVELNSRWFEVACLELVELEPFPSYFDGRIYSGFDESSWFSRQDIHTWRDSALSELQQRLADDLLFGRRYLHVVMSVEPHLYLVSLEVRAASEPDAQVTLDRLAEKLQLMKSDHNPYQSGRTQDAFAIDLWENERFTTTVREVINYYVSKTPDLINTYVVAESELRRPSPNELSRFRGVPQGTD